MKHFNPRYLKKRNEKRNETILSSLRVLNISPIKEIDKNFK